jgi:thiol-disulfide isomerase/thioredoxin
MPTDIIAQDQFEKLWFYGSTRPMPGMREKDYGWIMYFTASWCGPCKKLNLHELDEIAQARGLTIWRVDHSVNEYTVGYCNISKLPTFQFMTPRKIHSTMQTNDTQAIADWIKKL